MSKEYIPKKLFQGESLEEKKTPKIWYYRCNGFYKNIHTGKDKNGEPIIESHKFSCSAAYSKKGKACPNCGSTSAAVVELREDQSPPPDMFDCQEFCYMCDLYRPDGKGYGFRVYGPSCGIFGGYDSPMNDEQCKSCACRRCCTIDRENKFNSKNLVFNEDGSHREIDMSWLLNSRRPGETVIDFSRVKNTTKRG